MQSYSGDYFSLELFFFYRYMTVDKKKSGKLVLILYDNLISKLTWFIMLSSQLMMEISHKYVFMTKFHISA